MGQWNARFWQLLFEIADQISQQKLDIENTHYWLEYLWELHSTGMRESWYIFEKQLGNMLHLNNCKDKDFAWFW